MLTHRLHSHFVHMRHLSHCECINKMLVITVWHGSAKHCCKSGLKMNRKTPISDPRSSVTPKAIDLKFGTRDYVVGATQHAKT